MQKMYGDTESDIGKDMGEKIDIRSYMVAFRPAAPLQPINIQQAGESATTNPIMALRIPC